MSGSLPSLESIFHPSDFTEASETAFFHALKLAVSATSSLTLLHSDRSQDERHEFPGVRATLERWGRNLNESERSGMERLGLKVRKVVSRHANPVEGVLDYLESHPTDLIVLATHPHGERMSWLQHSRAEPIARGSGTSTLFVPTGSRGFVGREDGAVSLRNVLIPVAADPDPHLAVESAAAILNRLGLSEGAFCILHVGEPGQMPALRLPERKGWTWHRQTQRGPVVDVILDAAARTGADLIAMSTDGHHGFLDALRGNTTERVLRHAPCPLLAVPVRR